MMISDFLQNSGLKSLALAPLCSCEYSILLYLMNCAQLGLEQIIVTEVELADVIGFTSKEVNKALISLFDKQMIQIKYKDLNSPLQNNPSVNLSMQFDQQKWAPIIVESINSHDAIIYPFTRNNERILSGIPKEDSKETKEEWFHYLQEFDSESQKVDFVDAKKKHCQMESELKSSAQKWLDQSETKALSFDEVSILKLLIEHKHPRRQLFWAYQLRNRYQNLQSFFEENVGRMLAVTTLGTIVKIPPFK